MCENICLQQSFLFSTLCRPLVSRPQDDLCIFILISVMVSTQITLLADRWTQSFYWKCLSHIFSVATICESTKHDVLSLVEKIFFLMVSEVRVEVKGLKLLFFHPPWIVVCSEKQLFLNFLVSWYMVPLGEWSPQKISTL